MDYELIVHAGPFY